jgi:RNA polymerase sigma-70 factor (ECF subfamily)
VEQPEASEEIVQDIFMKLWEKKGSLVIETSLKSYLFRAVYNSCNNYLAHAQIKNRYISLVREAILKNELSSDPVLDSLTYKELDTKITEAIDALPTDCKRIFKMSRFDGMKYAEIAGQLQISVKTVETQISRALLKLRRELREFMVQT